MQSRRRVCATSELMDVPKAPKAKLLALLRNLRPGVAQGYDPVEDRRIRAVINQIGAKVAEPFELARESRLHVA